MTETTLHAPPTREALYAEVQQFYARHLQLLDDGRAQDWAQTFTEDGVFAPEHRPQPVVGRAALAEGARRSYADLVARGEVRRHWHGMISVDEPADDGSVRVRCYALIVGTPAGGEPRIVMSCVCADLLVRVDGRLLVRDRRVTKDGVAGSGQPA